MNAAEEILAIITDTVNKLDGQLMLVGAYARDYWIKERRVIGNARVTMDVDLACRVFSWEEYNRIVDGLKREGGLRQDAKIRHRLWLRDEIYADFVPFGGIEDENGDFAWPPDFDVSLNVLGYRLAYEDAETMTIGTASMKVISPCWLAMLKLKAYTDTPERTKDLVDVYFIIDHYLDFIDEDKRLYGPDATDADVFSIEPFDTRVAGATLIIRDCNVHGGETLRDIQAALRAFDANEAMSIVFARVNSLTQEVARQLLDILFMSIEEHHGNIE